VPLSQNPLVGPPAETLNNMGAKDLRLIRENNEFWRLITPIMLHGGVLHLALNMFSQFRVGLALEEKWGSQPWAIIYLASGVSGNLWSCYFNPGNIGVGASGAIYGIMGGWFADTVGTWARTDEVTRVGNLIQVVVNTGLGMVVSLVPIVDWAAHLGGFITGALLGFHFIKINSTSSYQYQGLPRSQNVGESNPTLQQSEWLHPQIYLLSCVLINLLFGYLMLTVPLPDKSVH